MDNVDVGQILTIISKGGLPAVILAILYGLAMLVREVKGGKLATDQNTALSKRVETLEAEMEEMKRALSEALESVHTMRFQRDQARVRVEYLEQKHGEERTVWPSDPMKGDV